MPHLRAITVRRPWGSLIARGRKVVETRTSLFPFQSLINISEPRDFVIHQGREWSDDYEERIQEVGMELYTEDYSHAMNFSGCPVAVVTLRQIARLSDDDPFPNALAMMRCNDQLYGIVMQNIRAATIRVPVRGQQGIWNIDGSIVNAMQLAPVESDAWRNLEDWR